jgi:hypothetical protein
MLDFVPANRINDVIYFNPADTAYPVAFNIMEKVELDQRHLVSSGLLGVFKKIWPDVWSPRMEYLLANAILALLEIPGATLLGVNRMFGEKDFRKRIVAQLADPVIKGFWENEFAKYPEQFMREAVAAIQNKVGQFSSNPLIRNVIGQVESSVDMRRVMDDRKILIINLSKGKIGEENARLLGAMMVTKLYLTAMGRVDIPEPERLDFYLYVDEFQNFDRVLCQHSLRSPQVPFEPNRGSSVCVPDGGDGAACRFRKRRHHDCLSRGRGGRRTPGEGVHARIHRAGSRQPRLQTDLYQADD